MPSKTILDTCVHVDIAVTTRPRHAEDQDLDKPAKAIGIKVSSISEYLSNSSK